MPASWLSKVRVRLHDMCTILVYRFEDKGCPVKVWLGKLTALDMVPLGWVGRKTSTQTTTMSFMEGYLEGNGESKTIIGHASNRPFGAYIQETRPLVRLAKHDSPLHVE